MAISIGLLIPELYENSPFWRESVELRSNMDENLY